MAEDWLDAAQHEVRTGDDERLIQASVYYHAAQAKALIAIAERLDRLCGLLEAVTGQSEYSELGFLRTVAIKGE